MGKYTRTNNFLKILLEDNPVLTLSAASTFNCILYRDILDFIQLALERDLTGIYNVVSNNRVSLGQMANRFGKQCQFGDFTYDCGDISNQKIIRDFDRFNQSSEHMIDLYMEGMACGKKS